MAQPSPQSNVPPSTAPLWLAQYPAGVPAEVEAPWRTLNKLLDESFAHHADKTMATFMGQGYRFAQIDRLSRQLAAWLQNAGLQAGDRVALMMPNVPQYLVAISAVLRAGMVVVNVNPLYTPRELNHQLKDSGAKAIIVLENFACTVEQSLQDTQISHIVLTEIGDLLSPIKRLVVNAGVRHIKKLIPAHQIERTGLVTRFRSALRARTASPYRPPLVGVTSPAFIQYTGGTTGVSKGATLTHANLCANVAQIEAWFEPIMRTLGPTHGRDVVCALPLYHIFALTGCFLMGLRLGMNSLLIPNPRDTQDLVRRLQGTRILMFPGVNTLFNALLDTPGFKELDFSQLRVTIGGGMAVQAKTAQAWFEATGCPVAEGYGLSETSPVVSLNQLTVSAFTGTIGLPLPSTDVAIMDAEGRSLPVGERGEICVRGPQVMAGYWRRPQETAEAMTRTGHFRTGDVGVMDAQGYIRIVDRKKDMVLVSGFNVYPSEVEDVINQMPEVLECAVIGVPDARSGEAVKAFVVPRSPALTVEAVQAHCTANLTGYKKPRQIVLCTDLPKSPVGKILRRELRDREAAA